MLLLVTLTLSFLNRVYVVQVLPVEFVATRACQIGTIQFAKGDKVDLKTKRQCSFGGMLSPDPLMSGCLLQKGFPRRFFPVPSQEYVGHASIVETQKYSQVHATIS